MDQETLIKLQLQMKQNNDDYKDFIDGMESWSEEIKNKETKFATDEKLNSNNNSYPIRNSAIKVKKTKEKKIKAYDYKAWDKFDVEKALNETDECDVDETQSKLQTIMQLVKEHREVGNIRFKEGDYTEATAEYSKAILLDENNAVLFANRAMSLTKMGSYEAAEVDCCKAIELDNTSVKAFYRRAKCRMLLQRNEEALDDLYSVLKLDPSNKVAQKEMYALEKNLNIRGVVEPIFGGPKKGVESSKPLVRINITDVDPNKHLQEVIKESSDNMIQTTTDEEMPTFTLPSTAVQLSKDLTKYRRNPMHRAKYVSLIDRNVYSKLIRHSLDSKLLQDLIDGLSFSLQNGFVSQEDFVASINSLSEVSRFSSLWLMMSADDKREFNIAISSLDSSLLSTLKAT